MYVCCSAKPSRGRGGGRQARLTDRRETDRRTDKNHRDLAHPAQRSPPPSPAPPVLFHHAREHIRGQLPYQRSIRNLGGNGRSQRFGPAPSSPPSLARAPSSISRSLKKKRGGSGGSGDGGTPTLSPDSSAYTSAAGKSKSRSKMSTRPPQPPRPPSPDAPLEGRRMNSGGSTSKRQQLGREASLVNQASLVRQNTALHKARTFAKSRNNLEVERAGGGGGGGRGPPQSRPAAKAGRGQEGQGPSTSSRPSLRNATATVSFR